MPALSYTALFVLQALAQGYRFGFDIMDATNLPSGTVYPALRRLEAMGLVLVVDEKYRLPQMNAVYCPKGVDEALVRRTLLNEFSLEIGAGLGPLAGKIWRFGLMGYSCRPDNVMLCLSALGSVLSDMGMPVHVGG